MGLMIGSVSVISDAINTGLDILTSIVAFFAVKIAGKPDDADLRSDIKKQKIYPEQLKLLIFSVRPDCL